MKAYVYILATTCWGCDVSAGSRSRLSSDLVDTVDVKSRQSQVDQIFSKPTQLVGDVDSCVFNNNNNTITGNAVTCPTPDEQCQV